MRKECFGISDRKPEKVHGKIRSATYHYVKRVGYLKADAGKYTKEVTLGWWSNRPGVKKLDIRKWNGNEYLHGISLYEEEVRALRRILDEIDFGK